MTFSCKLTRTCNALAFGALAALPLLTGTAVQAQAPDDAAHAALVQQRMVEREYARKEIATQRSAIAARQQVDEKACWQRFAVESCLTEVRAAVRDAENVLHDRELQLNREERQEKAQERLRAIEQKQREKRVPSPVVVTPRDGSGTLSMEQRHTQAQQRAADQARRVQAHEAAVADKQQEQAQARAEAVQAQREKQEAAQARRASKAHDIERQEGAPLPIPAMIPKP